MLNVAVQIAELHARATVRKSQGDAESTRLRADGDADAIRATGNAKAEAYRVGVESLGPESYALIQLMQIIGERNVRVVPDVAVTGATGANGLLDALMALMVKKERSGEDAS